MSEQNDRLPEPQPDLQETPAGFSVDALVIGIAAGLALGALVGFLTGKITLCLPIGILLGLTVGYLLDRRKDRAAGITQSPLSFWTAQKQAEPQQTAADSSEQQTEEEHETKDL